MTNAMPTVNVNTDQQRYAVGSLTGQVAYTTGGPAGGTLGTVSVYDRKGRVVRTVRKGLGGRTEDVHTAYSFTDAVDTVRAEVGVGYGYSFTANTVYTYVKGKKTKMTVSVSHSRTAQSRETKYTYDAIGRLTGKERQLTERGSSSCLYAYDLHGWLTAVDNGEFHERLYYADGLDGGCWNGNISTVKWRLGGDSFYLGYDLKYDDCNRLRNAVFGTGDNLGGNLFYYNEFTDYDCNGNVTRLKRHGLTDNLHVNFGLVDNLYMTYEGNRLTSVRDSASHFTYANATDFSGVTGQEYPLTYDASGALTSDAGRGMARIDYDLCGNPVRIQFTDGSVTRYIYSAAGEKLRVTHLTAVPNITVPIGTTRELAPSEILAADSTDYLLGGTLTMRNGRIDRYLFDEGYCQAAKYASNPVQDGFTPYYFDRDHLGSVRQVIKAYGSTKGTVVQRMEYYPSGLQFCDNTTDSDVQPQRYNGKELDKMHGLNTYDYGARQYNPIVGRWDRMDPLCEKYYSISPYAYCHDNPINKIDPDGRDDYKLNADGYLELWRRTNAKTTDRVFTIDKKDNITIKKTTTKQLMAKRDDYDGNYAAGGSEMIDLFYFVTNNTNVEWLLNGYKNGNSNSYLIATRHKEDRVKHTDGGNNKLDLFISIHSHPGNSPAKASGYGRNSEQNGILYSYGDDQFNVNNVYNLFKNAGKTYPSQFPKFYIYHPATQTRIGYDPFKPRTSVKKIKMSSDLIL